MRKTISILAYFFSFLNINLVVAEQSFNLKTPSFKEGTVIKIEIEANAPDGILIQQIDNEDKYGTMSVHKDYSLERKTVSLASDEETKIHYNIKNVRTNIKIKYDDEDTPHFKNLALRDIVVLGVKDTTGEWQFSVQNGKITPDIEALVSELQAYENRKWFADHPVKIGDTWQIYPAFTDFVMTRDLQRVKTEGTMELLNVNNENKMATLKFNAKSRGWDENPEKGIRKANFETQGLLHYSLDLNLDMKLVVTSQLESFYQTNGTTVSAILPFTYKVTKAIQN